MDLWRRVLLIITIIDKYQQDSSNPDVQHVVIFSLVWRLQLW